jgi:hypothetical protein
MLTQRIAKELCAVVQGEAVLGSAEDLAKSMKMFEASQLALKDGAAALGITAPRTKQIDDGQEKVWTLWRDIRETLAAAGKGDPDAVQQLGPLVASLDAIATAMTDITALMGKASKQNF